MKGKVYDVPRRVQEPSHSRKLRALCDPWSKINTSNTQKIILKYQVSAQPGAWALKSLLCWTLKEFKFNTVFLGVSLFQNRYLYNSRLFKLQKRIQWFLHHFACKINAWAPGAGARQRSNSAWGITFCTEMGWWWWWCWTDVLNIELKILFH